MGDALTNQKVIMTPEKHTLVELLWKQLLYAHLVTVLPTHQFPVVLGSLVDYAHVVQPNQSHQHNIMF